MTYPTITPKLTLDFANSRQLDPRITFSRSSTATYLHPDTGLITTAPSGVARFEKEGLLIEEARTNLIDYSTDFQNQWAGGSATNNQTLAPDGTSTAAKYAAAATVSLNKTYTSTNRPNTALKFNLATGTYDSTIVGTPTDYDIEPYGNGWYRCWFSVSNTTFSVFAKKGELDYIVIQLSNVKGFIYARNATDNNTSTSDGIYIWGAQIEAVSFPTSYIPTSGSTVTRAADIVSMTGTEFSSWYNNSEGSFVCEFNHPYAANGDDRIFMAASSNASADRIGASVRNTLQVTYALAKTNSVNILAATMTGTDGSLSPTLGVGYSSATDGFRWVQQGVVRTATGTPSTAIDRLLLGQTNAAGATDNKLSGHIFRLTYYDRRVSDAELETLTS